jgi:hypothetical protein
MPDNTTPAGRPFTLADLQEILTKIGAPQVADTFNASCVVEDVCTLINQRHFVPPKTPPELKKCRESLTVLEKNLPIIIKRYERNEADLRSRHGLDETAQPGEHHSRRVARLLDAVHNVRPAITYSVRERGSHGGHVDYVAARDLHQRLFWAWQEAGAPPGNRRTTHKIVAELLSLGGMAVPWETIEKKTKVDRTPLKVTEFRGN